MKKVTYRKECKIRVVGVGGVEVTLPKLVIERAARAEGQTIEEFVKTHKLVHLFNDFTDFDAAYRFERIKETEEIEVIELDKVEKPKPPTLTERREKPVPFDEMRRRLKEGK